VFLSIGLPGLILALLVLLVVKEPKRRTEPGAIDSKPSIAEAFSFLWQNRRVYAGLFIGMGLLAMFGYGASAWYPSYLQRVRGFDIADAGLFLGVATLVLGIAGGLTAGWLADLLLARGRRDAHSLVSIGYCLGFALCGVIGPLAESRWISLPLIALSLFFSNTIIGVVAAALQIVTPNRMRGQISAFFLFTAAFIGLAFGPSAVAFATDHIFHDDNAVGYSLALVAAIFPTLGALVFNLGRKPLLEPPASPDQ
jgi:sugar phosphate permease